MAEKKEKRYVSDNAQLMAEWNWEKNKKLNFNPETLTISNGKKVWWKCSKGHEWQATVNNRKKGSNCPYCAGRKVLKGYNDLQTVNPTLANEWNYVKNGVLTPDQITACSGKEVWWKCHKGHEWSAVIYSRNSGRGCPICTSKKVLVGYNDLQTINPTLANEWNYERNSGLLPSQVLSGSGKKVWWKCCKGHEWQATIVDRNNGADCPYCNNKKVLVGYNDLQTINPTLANEWNYERNNGLLPSQVLSGSRKKVWWKCSKGHEWPAAIYSRNTGRNCPICSSERSTSFPEYAFVYYLKKYGIDVTQSNMDLGYELDIYIPSLKIAIEYDGYYWHKGREKSDLEKNHKCKKAGITLYRIREGLLSLKDSSFDYCIQKDQSDLPNAMSSIIQKVLGCNVDIDIDLNRDEIAIENLREHSEKEHSVAVVLPHLAKEWNYEKNKNLKPEHFSIHSGKKVWWICSKGHEWQATIDNRSKGGGCPYCSNRKVLAGYNDLLTINPTLAKEWNYDRNGNLKPEHFTANSGKKVWWKCNNGHYWQARIQNRNNGNGCPQCAKEKRTKANNS